MYYSFQKICQCHGTKGCTKQQDIVPTGRIASVLMAEQQRIELSVKVCDSPGTYELFYQINAGEDILAYLA